MRRHLPRSSSRSRSLCLGERALQVSIEGRGQRRQAGALTCSVELLEEGLRHGRRTLLTYDAQAGVRGLVARLGAATLSVVGAHLTGCFFRDLDRSLVASRPRTARTAAHA